MSLRRASSAPVLWLSLLLGVCVTSVHACEPDLVDFMPTPTLMWDYDEVAQNDVVAYRVYYRGSTEDWTVDHSWDLGCWMYEDEGQYSRSYCYGRDLDTAVQRIVERDYEYVEYAVTAIDRWGSESAKSNSVYICQPAIWRGGQME